MMNEIKITRAKDPKVGLEYADRYIIEHTQSRYPEVNDFTKEEYSFLAYDGADIVGAIFATTKYDTIYVNKLGVHRDYRRLKIGTQLLQAMEQLANNLQCQTITLTTLNYQALGFYQKYDYKLYGQIDDNPRRGVTQYLLYKRLAAY